MIKLYKARSVLYRCQLLQENIRWKALDEIYKIYMLLHRSDLNISEMFLNFERSLTELRSEKFEWFDPSPIETFNLGQQGRDQRSRRARARQR